MAYTANTLSMWTGGPVEGAQKLWTYVTSDTLLTVKGASYFSDGVSRGMQVGDFVMVVNPGTAYALYAVTSVSGAAATVAGSAIALT
jgi:hypothetical protein